MGSGRMEGEEGVGITDEGAASQTRVQHPGQGHSIPDEGAASQTRAQNHPQGHSVTDEGVVGWEAQTKAWQGEGVSSTDEGTARGMSAPWMKRAAQTAGCMAMHMLQPARADVPGGHGGDDSGDGAGGAAVPHLRHVADACGGCRASAAAQFMMYALGCILDSKGAWG